MPSIGEMSFRAEFQSRMLVADADGNEVPSGEWSTILTAWGRLVPLRGGEEFTAARLEGRQPYAFTIYSNPMSRSIAETWRVVDVLRPSRVFSIVAPPIDPFGNRRFIDLLLVEGAPS